MYPFWYYLIKSYSSQKTSFEILKVKSKAVQSISMKKEDI